MELTKQDNINNRKNYHKNYYDDELFSKFIKISVILHALVIGLSFIWSFISSNQDPIRISPSIRVDLVALPDVKKSDLSQYEASDKTNLNALEEKLSKTEASAKKALQKIQEEVKQEESMSLQKKKGKETRKDSLKNALERIKALDSIEKSQSSRKKTVIAKGNTLSKGTSLTGENTGETSEFVSRMQSKLHDNWNLPVWLSKQNLNAKVVLFLDSKGYVSKTVFAQPSGNQQFDDFVLKTIRMSQPFNAPPDEVLEGGITLGFPL
jgi:outer membrane biosynthesis protein TonB